MVVNNEAGHALGELGLREAIPTLIAESRFTDDTDDNTKAIAGARRMGAAIGLARIHRDPGDDQTVREAIQAVYQKADKEPRMQLLRAMQHLFDPGVQPFLLTVARTPEDELPDIRVIALNAFSLLANAAEAQQARALIEHEPGPEDGGFKTTFTEQNDKALTAAAECNEDLACWIRKLGDRDKEIRTKAAYMIARYGRGNASAITALVGKLDDPEETVRGDVLYALDFVADHGSPEGAAKIMDMKAHEEGRAIWAHVKPLALPTAGRLRLRAAH
jgi:HEAT repeat protein